MGKRCLGNHKSAKQEEIQKERIGEIIKTRLTKDLLARAEKIFCLKNLGFRQSRVLVQKLAKGVAAGRPYADMMCALYSSTAR